MGQKRTAVGALLVAILVVGTFFISTMGSNPSMAKDLTKAPIPEVISPSGQVEVAVMAGGCFWCVQPPFDKKQGVLATTVGYVGGPEADPNYRDVAMGRTGHTEAIRVAFDPAQITYAQILDIFWRIHDPTDAGGQFVDRGSQYRPGIFYATPEQKATAEASRAKLAENGPFKRPIVTEITALERFWPAEMYHQAYYKKDPTTYYRYRKGSGRDAFIEKYWGLAEQK